MKRFIRFSHWHVGLCLALAVVLFVVDAYNIAHEGVNLDRWIPFLMPAAFIAFARIAHIVHRT